MRVAVLGGGVIGVTTAYFLASEGAEVVVIDRGNEVATETSAVNAGLLASVHAFTWAGPGAVRTLLRSLGGADTALRLHWRVDPDLWAWGLKFLRNCSVDRSTRNTLRRLRLAQYSRRVLDGLVEETGIAFHQNRGALFLYRSRESMAAGVAHFRLVKEHGEEQEELGPAECVEMEPALAPARDRIAGAVYSRTTMSGDSALFSRRLAERAAELGARFRLGTDISGFAVSEGRIRGVDTDAGLIEADRYVLAAGVGSRRIAKSAGLDLRIYPVKGYTLTAPVAEEAPAPTMSGIDEDRLVAWSRFGDRLRMTGTADFAGHDLSVNEEDARAIFRSGGELFPDAVRWDEREMRSGLRPVTPDENPFLGPTDRYPELLLNTGHGNLGWVMAAGSARIVADLALGKAPELDPVEFDLTSA